MAQRHERFSLHAVTFDGVSMPGATVDCWHDASGRPQWQARVLTRARPTIDEGELSGQTADGHLLKGHVRVVDDQVGAGSRRETIVVFHGTGVLHGR